MNGRHVVSVLTAFLMMCSSVLMNVSPVSAAENDVFQGNPETTEIVEDDQAVYNAGPDDIVYGSDEEEDSFEDGSGFNNVTSIPVAYRKCGIRT